MGIIDIVILLSSCVIDIYLFYSFFDNFFEKRFVFSDNKRVRIGVNCLVILVLFVGNIFGNGDLNAFWTPIITCIYVWIVFRGKIGNKLLYFMVALLIIFGCEWLFAIILNLDNDAYKNMSEIPFILFALKLLTYILFVIVEQFVGKNKKKMDNWTF